MFVVFYGIIYWHLESEENQRETRREVPVGRKTTRRGPTKDTIEFEKDSKEEKKSTEETKEEDSSKEDDDDDDDKPEDKEGSCQECFKVGRNF